MKGSNKLNVGNLNLRKTEYPKLLKIDQIFLLQVVFFIFSFENNLLAPFSDITSLLFDTEFTSITPGPPLRIVFHFLELIFKKILCSLSRT